MKYIIGAIVSLGLALRIGFAQDDPARLGIFPLNDVPLESNLEHPCLQLYKTMDPLNGRYVDSYILRLRNDSHDLCIASGKSSIGTSIFVYGKENDKTINLTLSQKVFTKDSFGPWAKIIAENDTYYLNLHRAGILEEFRPEEEKAYFKLYSKTAKGRKVLLAKQNCLQKDINYPYITDKAGGRSPVDENLPTGPRIWLSKTLDGSSKMVHEFDRVWIQGAGKYSQQILLATSIFREQSGVYVNVLGLRLAEKNGRSFYNFARHKISDSVPAQDIVHIPAPTIGKYLEEGRSLTLGDIGAGIKKQRYPNRTYFRCFQYKKAADGSFKTTGASLSLEYELAGENRVYSLEINPITYAREFGAYARKVNEGIISEDTGSLVFEATKDHFLFCPQYENTIE